MRYLHTSDWHIGECRRHPNYLKRHRNVLRQIFEVALRRSCDAILVAGDVFHRLDTTHEERDLLFQLIQEYDGRILTIFISGNHDEITVDASQISSFYKIRRHFESFRFVTPKPELLTIKPGHYVMAIPWGGYSEKELAKIIRSNQPDSFRSYTVMCHEAFFGYHTDGGHYSEKGSKLPYVEGVTYIAAGDIHRYQLIQGHKNAFYSGAPAQWRFDDTLPKGVLIVETSDPQNPEFVELDSIPMVVVTKAEDLERYQVDGSAYVSLRVPLHELEGINIPLTVVDQSPVSDIPPSDDEGIVDGVDLTDGLDEFLRAFLPASRDRKEAHDIVIEALAKL